MAKYEIAFHVPVKTFQGILEHYGFAKEREAVRTAFERGDAEAMADAISEDMVDAISIAGTPDDCRSQLADYDGILDLIVLHATTFGASREYINEGFMSILETFSGRTVRK